jgi:hypothetical protein
MPSRQLVGAVDADDGDAVAGDRIGDRRQGRETRLVGPLQIVEEQNGRLRPTGQSRPDAVDDRVRRWGSARQDRAQDAVRRRRPRGADPTPDRGRPVREHRVDECRLADAGLAADECHRRSGHGAAVHGGPGNGRAGPRHEPVNELTAVPIATDQSGSHPFRVVHDRAN